MQEAEAGVLAGMFVVGNDAAASGGQYVHAPPGSGYWDTVTGNGNRADYCFQVTTAGVYRIRGWVYAAQSSTNSFFVQVDGSPAAGYLWDVRLNTAYLTDYVNDRQAVVVDPVEVSLGVGDHSLTVFMREDGTRLDKLELELVSASLSAPPAPTEIAPSATATPIPTGIVIPTATPTATAASTATPTGIAPSATATQIPTGEVTWHLLVWTRPG